MKNQMILEKSEGAVLTLTLNRPERRNAFDFHLAEKLGEMLKKAKGNKGIRVVVLRGAGEGFSAGGDLKVFHQHLQRSYQAFRKITGYLNQAISLIRSMPKPVIAAIQGPAYAAGFGLALSCDLIVASHNSRLSPSFIKLALAPNAASTYFLPRLIGSKLAAEAFMRGKVFTASEALNLGMINHVWAEESFEEELKLLADDLAARPSASLARIKKLLNATLGNSLVRQLKMERKGIAISSLSEDFKTSIKGFVEKS
jgi:2-(1,2-epoxy-1,2-dihydrophenyl)acetyl-CoA isomerase